MEIERKFLMDGFPKLPQREMVQMEQGYLSHAPSVRIRRSIFEDGRRTYILCIKGKGTLVREEVELPMDEDQYERLKALLPMEPVRKELHLYDLPGGRTLECSLVDGGTDTAFYYAEVEFPTVEEAEAFTPPAYLGREVTEEKGHTMAAYWRRKLRARQEAEEKQ